MGNAGGTEQFLCETGKVNVYALRLAPNELKITQYYVGATKLHPGERFHQHVRGSGAAFTKKYSPVAIVETFPNCDPFDELKYTLKYVQMHGVDNVRGSHFAEVILPPAKKRQAKELVWASSKVCTRCGHASHYIKDCFACTDVDGDAIDEVERCYRCGRDSHTKDTCTEIKDVDSNVLPRRRIRVKRVRVLA